ncbi:MAG: hypothetical protein ABI579_08000 [Candidatus Sumerlaeota bacterium]
MDAARGESSRPLKNFLTSRGGSFLLFALVTLLVFHRALLNDYAYDGTEVMRRISQPNPVPVSALFSPSQYGLMTGVMSWRPLSLAMFMIIDRDLFHANAALSHGLNLLVHALNGWLLFLLARKLGMRDAMAMFAGLFFLVHPLVSEVVLCAGFGFDLLAVFFSLLTILFTMRASEGAAIDGRYLAAAITACLLGLAAKENAALAVPMAALIVLVHTRDKRRALITAGLLGASAAAFVVVWSLFKYGDAPARYMGGAGRALGMGNFLVAFREIYFKKFLIPWPLRIDYEFQQAASLADRRVVEGMFCAGLLLAAGVIASWWRKNILLGAAWIACGFATVSQIIAVPDPVAERFCYMPMAGTALIAADVVSMILNSGGRGRASSTSIGLLEKMAVVLGIIFVVLLGGLSWRRSLDWRDDTTLNIANWEQPGEKSAKARLTLGALYLTRAAQAHSLSDETAARDWEQKSESSLSPLMKSAPPAEALRMMGVLALMRGDKDGARELAARALQQEPENPLVQKLAAATGLLPAKK